MPAHSFRFKALLALFCALALPALCRADHEFFPEAHGVFQPLIADPRELQYALRLVTPVSHQVNGEAAIGDYLGILRWNSGSTTYQWNAGGGVFGRFDLASEANDMKSADFFANIPLDWRHNRWSGRMMIYHTSSHLGDDYLKTSGQETVKHSWDNLRGLVAFEPVSRLRLLGGYAFAFRQLPAHTGRNSIQGGLEWRTRRYDDHFEWYWANDVQSRERSDWTPTYVSQAGIAVYKNSESHRGMSFFVEFGSGPRSEGQFYKRKETRWTLGASFRLT